MRRVTIRLYRYYDDIEQLSDGEAAGLRESVFNDFHKKVERLTGSPWCPYPGLTAFQERDDVELAAARRALFPPRNRLGDEFVKEGERALPHESGLASRPAGLSLLRENHRSVHHEPPLPGAKGIRLLSPLSTGICAKITRSADCGSPVITAAGP